MQQLTRPTGQPFNLLHQITSGQRYNVCKASEPRSVLESIAIWERREKGFVVIAIQVVRVMNQNNIGQIAEDLDVYPPSLSGTVVHEHKAELTMPYVVPGFKMHGLKSDITERLWLRTLWNVAKSVMGAAKVSELCQPSYIQIHSVRISGLLQNWDVMDYRCAEVAAPQLQYRPFGGVDGGKEDDSVTPPSQILGQHEMTFQGISPHFFIWRGI